MTKEAFEQIKEGLEEALEQVRTIPAFPCAEDHKTADQLPWTAGMTLRDWFAGQALIGMLSGDQSPDKDWVEQVTAPKAYRVADAMLKARQS